MKRPERERVAHLTDLAPSDDLAVSLAQLAGSPDLSQRAQRTADRLLRRLTNPVQVGLFGPLGDEIGAQLMGACETLLDDVACKRAATVSGSDDFRDIDIGLWCTSHFDESEDAQWNMSPDALKDHSFLVGLTEADPDPAWLDAMQDIAGEQFFTFVPVHIRGEIPDVGTLRDSIAKRVASGRLADHDQATLFVQTHKAHLSPVSPTAAVSAVRSTAPQVPSEPTSADARFEKALKDLEETADRLGGVSMANEDEACAEILSICSDTAEALADTIGAADASDLDHRALAEDILAASDELILMSLEENVASAVDAVTVLFQIRKDLSQRMAA